MNKTSIVVPVTGTADISTKSVGECLKSTSNFTETIYTNVCNGQSYSIPMGSMDIAGSMAIVLFVVAIGVVVTAMVLNLIFD